jgi:hypothetical protein
MRVPSRSSHLQVLAGASVPAAVLYGLYKSSETDEKSVASSLIRPFTHALSISPSACAAYPTPLKKPDNDKRPWTIDRIREEYGVAKAVQVRKYYIRMHAISLMIM